MARTRGCPITLGIAAILLAGCAALPFSPVDPATGSDAVDGATESDRTSVTPASPATVPVPSTSQTPTATASATPTATSSTPAAASRSGSTPSPSPTEPAKDTRSGAELDQPYTVNGIPVVSKSHPISKRFRRQNPGKYGLEKEAATALAELIAAAKSDGVRVVVRSGYRSYAEQEKILKRKIAEYGDEKLARRYNAEAGKSEHQTGLAVDLWDGDTWGLGVRNTKTGKWLWKHSREYGFILRYPPDKEKITGYAYEPWHFRYIGVADSLKFKANSALTLEEYLGIA